MARKEFDDYEVGDVVGDMGDSAALARRFEVVSDVQWNDDLFHGSPSYAPPSFASYIERFFPKGDMRYVNKNVVVIDRTQKALKCAYSYDNRFSGIIVLAAKGVS